MRLKQIKKIAQELPFDVILTEGALEIMLHDDPTISEWALELHEDIVSRTILATEMIDALTYADISEDIHPLHNELIIALHILKRANVRSAVRLINEILKRPEKQMNLAYKYAVYINKAIIQIKKDKDDYGTETTD